MKRPILRPVPILLLAVGYLLPAACCPQAGPSLPLPSSVRRSLLPSPVGRRLAVTDRSAAVDPAVRLQMDDEVRVIERVY